MNFNDKFLNLCFKLGKILFSILLVISLIISIVLLCDSGIKAYKASKVELTYSYDVHNAFNNLYSDMFSLADTEKTQNNQDANNSDKISKNKSKATELLAEFVSANKLPKNIVLNNFKHPTDDKRIIPYVEGFIAYYGNYTKEFKKLLVEQAKINSEEADKIINENKVNLYNDAINAYVEEYLKEVDAIEQQKQLQVTDRNTVFIAFLISISVFALFMFLPILIRIEENTRK